MSTKFDLRSWLMYCLLLLPAAATIEAKCVYGPVTFSSSFVDSGVLFYNTGRVDLPVRFDFGDGQSFYGVRPQNGIFHKYAKNGSYTVTMYYNDTIQYCKDTAVQQICFFKLADSISFRRSNDTLYASAPCHVNAFYRWAWGNSSYGKGCNTWHVYSKPDYYYPQLMFVTDTPSGCPYYYNTKYQVMDFTICGFSARFYAEKYMGLQVLRLKAIVGSGPFIDPKKKQNGRETWYWGDGTSSTENGIVADKDTHFYSTHGMYNICHVYEDSAQCKDSVCSLVQVDSCNAYAGFTYTTSFREVSFNFKVSGSYSWYVDGVKITLSNGKYVFSSNGTYNVCLKATGMDNCMVETCKMITVFKCDPISMSKISWQQPGNDCSTYKFINTNSNYQVFNWDFGDNTSSSDKEPVHSYGPDSVYTVKLTAIDTIDNCRDSVTFYLWKFCCNIQDSVILTKTSLSKATIENHSYIRQPKGPVHRHKWVFDHSYVSYDAVPSYTYYSRGYRDIYYIAYDTIRDCQDSFHYYLHIDDDDSLPFVLNFGNSSGISDLNTVINVIVYPNPANDKLNIQTGTDEAIYIYNILGELLAVLKPEDGYALADISGLPEGIYILRCGRSSVKFIKQE